MISTITMSVGRDNASASRFEYVLFRGERVIAREDGFKSTAAARSAGRAKAEDIEAGRAKPIDHERDQRVIALRLASPKRASAGKPLEQQQDAAHLPLFVHANEPTLF